MRKFTLLIILAVSVSSVLFSQDLHFTNYYYSPLYLSPAKTGDFAGTYRFSVNARTQFDSFIIQPYRTLMVSADMNIAAGFKPYHWISVGLNIFTDSAGDLSYRTTGAHASAAYHYAFDQKYNTVITLGLQVGLTQRRIDNSRYASETSLREGLNADSDLDLLENFNPNISDFNFGLSFKKKTSKKAYIDLGVALNHATQSDFMFTGSTTRQIVGRRVNAYAEYFVQSSKKLAFRPTIVYSRMFNFQNLFGQLNFEYKPNKKTETILKGGLGYRVGDAIQFLAGAVYKGWDVGIAYDLTVSTAQRLTNGFGGFEIGLRKILIANKEPEAPPVILCPRF